MAPSGGEYRTASPSLSCLCVPAMWISILKGQKATELSLLGHNFTRSLCTPSTGFRYRSECCSSVAILRMDWQMDTHQDLPQHISTQLVLSHFVHLFSHPLLYSAILCAFLFLLFYMSLFFLSTAPHVPPANSDPPPHAPTHQKSTLL